MRCTLISAGCLFGIVLAVAAHRLDECLQAIRVGVFTDRVELAVDITPGAAVAGGVLKVIDSDRDGRISKAEEEGYGRAVLNDMALRLDDRRLSLTPISVQMPPVPQIRDGTGAIRVRAAGAFDRLRPGAHALTLTNTHLPDLSVYLVNALRSKDRSVEIGRQTRDESQRGYRLDFMVTRQPPGTGVNPRQ
ncbi:MAG: hypothetical protein FJ405_02315 [Verrucomicrobia bacterium]|nr:hypothetical protein [Verrucomicrobiota bacterium]